MKAFSLCQFLFCPIILLSLISNNLVESKSKSIQATDICFERTLLPNSWYDYIIDDEYPIYNGFDMESEFLDTIYVFDSDYSKRQYKKELEKSRYMRLNIDLSEYAAMIVLVNNVNEIEDYDYEYIESDYVVELPRTKNLEVLCPDQINHNLKKAICEKLKNQGAKVSCDKLNKEGYFSAILTQFQKNNELPIGSLNMITLQFLDL